MTSNLRRRDRCRMCESPRLELALPIKASPIADAYVPAARLGQVQATYPLDLYLCLDCGHVQNRDIVDPEILFRDYLFLTSASGGLVEHFRGYAAEVISQFGIGPGSLVVEIGSNDGSLLRFFKEQGMKVLGIDPAREIARQATQTGVPTLPEFFGSTIASSIRAEHGPASVIAANNVFAHADNLADIVTGVRDLLADDGIFVFEVSYLADIIDRFLFDTVYHEHVSYHSISPLARFFERLGMHLFDVRRIASKGGSIRGFAQRRDGGKRTQTAAVRELIALERQRGLGSLEPYRAYEGRINVRKKALLDLLDMEAGKGALIAGYGASTTTTTLMWHFELTRKLAFLADDNPHKHGLFSPGAHIPVVPSEELYVRRPDCVIVLAWIYAEPIIRRHQRFLEEGGKFIIPLPDLKVVGQQTSRAAT
jgi:SAM-dependent methyltransferase